MDEKRLKPRSDTAAQILALYRQLTPERKREFMALVKELSSATQRESAAGPASTAQQDS